MIILNIGVAHLSFYYSSYSFVSSQPTLANFTEISWIGFPIVSPAFTVSNASYTYSIEHTYDYSHYCVQSWIRISAMRFI